jgi:hypothetical protein
LAYYSNNSNTFKKFNGHRNNCSRVIIEYLSLLGIKFNNLTPWADTVRNIGKINYNPMFLQEGDIIAMGRPGDTHHVGVYMGGTNVLHQSRGRGYVVGVYEDLKAFTGHYAGFYSIRPDYSIYSKPVESFIASPGPLSAPALGS